MKRSAGVTVIAILSLLGSLFTLVMGALMAVIPFVASRAQPNESPFTPRTFKVLMIGVSAFYVLPAIWGILTSIGLFRLKDWARISIIVFSVLLILMSGFAILMVVVMPIPPAPNQAVDPAIAAGVRAFMAAFAAGLIAIGTWWLVYFTRVRVKQQFMPLQPELAGGPPFATPYSVPVPSATTAALSPAGRPLSLTVLAWFLLAGCLFTPFNVWLHPPAVLFAKIVTGWPSALYFLAFCGLKLYIGIGLLRLQLAARTVAVAYYVFWFVNMAVFYLAPGGRLRMLELMQRSQSIFPWMRTQPWQSQMAMPFDTTRFLVLGACFGLAGMLVPLYFLVTRKQAFEKAAADAADRRRTATSAIH